LGELESTLNSQQKITLLNWCEQKQNVGYQGRTNKAPDSCYSFWIGGALQMMGRFDDLNVENIEHFLCDQCQHKKLGGFSKYPGEYPDLIHSFYSLATLSMTKLSFPSETIAVKTSAELDQTAVSNTVQELDPRFGICKNKIKFYFG
jgi:prenyltransferase beta subunit